MSKVTLTFDNGPEPSVTPQVLDCLARHRVSATFFVVGQKAATPAGRELVRRTSAEGHRIGSHTWSHRACLGDLDAISALEEFERGAEAVAQCGVAERLFRPKGGGGRIGKHVLHPAVASALQEGGYTLVLWNSVPGDWRDPEGWEKRALDDVRERDWTLLVLHDLPSGAMAHLDSFLRRLQKEGHTFKQDFPPDCVPILDGRAVQAIEPYVSANR